jgi:hypothetical protein
MNFILRFMSLLAWHSIWSRGTICFGIQNALVEFSQEIGLSDKKGLKILNYYELFYVAMTRWITLIRQKMENHVTQIVSRIDKVV